MRVSVNGTEIFSGPCRFPEHTWGRMGLNIPAGILKDGENRIVIENTTKDFPSRSARFKDPKEAATDSQWGWIALSEAYWLDPNNEFTRYLNGDFTTPWCYNDGNTRSAPPTGITDGKAVITSNEGPSFYIGHQYPKLAITPGDKVKLTVKASGTGNLRLYLWNYRPYKDPDGKQILQNGYAGGGVNLLQAVKSEPFALSPETREFTCVVTPVKGTGLVIPSIALDGGIRAEITDFWMELVPPELAK